MQDLQSLETEITAKLAVATSVGDVENIRIAELGKKGRVSLLMRELGKMTPEEKNEFSPKLNQLKNTKVVSCKDVTFRFFGLSLATINTIISIFLSGIMIKVIKNYGQNK